MCWKDLLSSHLIELSFQHFLKSFSFHEREWHKKWREGYGKTVVPPLSILVVKSVFILSSDEKEIFLCLQYSQFQRIRQTNSTPLLSSPECVRITGYLFSKTRWFCQYFEPVRVCLCLLPCCFFDVYMCLILLCFVVSLTCNRNLFHSVRIWLKESFLFQWL